MHFFKEKNSQILIFKYNIKIANVSCLPDIKFFSQVFWYRVRPIKTDATFFALNTETFFAIYFVRLALYLCLKNIGDCMRSHNGSIDTTHTPPHLPCHFTIHLMARFSHIFVRPNYYILQYKFELLQSVTAFKERK